MIVIGVDVHKQSLTAVAVDEAGRVLEERTLACGERSLLAWAGGLGNDRLWALEDCRHVTGALERLLLAAGEELVRVPPKLTGIARRAGRERGKSDPIDALAVARVALREPDLPRPRPGEERYRELKLLVVYRDDLIDERRRAQQRLRWHLHQLDASFVVPSGALDRTVWLERVGRWLSRRPRGVRVRLARDLVSRCRSLTRMIVELDRELETLSAQIAPTLLTLPGCGGLTAAKLLAEIGPIERFHTDAQLARHGGVAPLQASSGRTQRHRLDRGGNRQLNCALHRIAITQSRVHPPARAYLRTQTSRRKEPTRSDPLPQTTTRTHRLQHAEERAAIDIGATLAQAASGPSWLTSTVTAMRADIDKLLQDLTLRALAFGIAIGWSLFSVAHGFAVFIDGLATHLPAQDGPFLQTVSGGGLTWNVGNHIVALDSLLVGLVEFAVVVATAAYLSSRQPTD